MTANLTVPRSDITYLRRRVRPGQEPVRQPPTATVSTNTGTSLRLSAPDASATAAKYETPVLTTNTTLKDTNPVVRFNNRQSAVGSLTIEGATEFGWEADGKRGYTLASQPDVDPEIPVNAGRPLVQFYKGQIVLGLRHFKQLRRLIVPGSADFVVATIGGNRVVIEPDNDGRQVLLFVYRLGNVLELRREVAVDDFGFRQVRPYTGLNSR